jgi:hypothetical protein
LYAFKQQKDFFATPLGVVAMFLPRTYALQKRERGCKDETKTAGRAQFTNRK